MFAYQKIFDTPNYQAEMPQLQGVETAREVVKRLMNTAADDNPPIYAEVQAAFKWDPHNKNTSPGSDLFEEYCDLFDQEYEKLNAIT